MTDDSQTAAANGEVEGEAEAADSVQPDAPSEPLSDPVPLDNAEELRRQRDEFQELLLRKTAELDNVRKRADRERLQLQQAAASDLLEALLPVVDDLERALAVPPESTSATAYRDGVELIQKQLLDILERRGVEPIDVVGAQFDPNYHQAVAVDEGEGQEDGQVTAELRRGYTVRGRLLRAAMVRVAKG